MSPKDNTPTKTRTGVVHSIPDGDCTATYVGQTKLSITRRLKKHKRALTTYTMLQLLLPAINWIDTDILTIPTVYNIREMLLRHSISDFSRIQLIGIKACSYAPTTVYYHHKHHQNVHAYFSKYVRVHIL